MWGIGPMQERFIAPHDRQAFRSNRADDMKAELHGPSINCRRISRNGKRDTAMKRITKTIDLNALEGLIKGWMGNG
jgi:hypothetical protein